MCWADSCALRCGADRGEILGFRPKQFRNLHCVISTSFDPVEGVLLWNEIGVNSPEPYEMAARKKIINDKTPFAVSYSSECNCRIILRFHRRLTR